ncbi:TatD related deoxyribonuclease [Trypanosoma rangeli]|uniref:TatD related deoxyribonuclease n=1 Tax=Trypanosoma rangeli TaxID=5698 RepID=A0A3R7K0P4_TRYRA|nr:TatD related deoxyribonuclease [Trypanosoma rangeli]RNE99804.1 TatD related deoxyribonuclease [Trypanosoma rangeli]|eukprot:RNE99804.1 TatD related deoxyribonuclease [Trypanosoma rangeli]
MRKASGGPYLIDAALNLTDCVFYGVDWKGRRVHANDFEEVLRRAEEQNVKQMVITGTSLVQCVKAIRLCRRYPLQLRCTIGIHPAHSAELMQPIDWASIEKAAGDEASIQIPQPPPPSTDAAEAGKCTEERLSKLVELIEANRDVVVAVGEIGLDYAELAHCPRDVQQKYFVQQLRAFRLLGLPFIFHSRDCGTDFVRLLEEEQLSWPVDTPFLGVVHSFNGPLEEQQRLLVMPGIYFSINGSAFREKSTAEQICRLPLGRVMLETDAPWCDIRKQHYGAKFVRTHFATNRKGGPYVATLCHERRNEPCHLRQVLEAYVGALHDFGQETADVTLQEITEEEVMRRVYDNCATVFRLQ